VLLRFDGVESVYRVWLNGIEIGVGKGSRLVQEFDVSQELWESADIPSRFPPRDPEYARGSEGVPTDFLKTFYRDAYRRIRAESSDVVIVFHDGFRLREWADYFTTSGFERFFVDTHQYLMMLTFAAGDQDLERYLDHVRTEFQTTVEEMGVQMPLLVGEWCLDPMSTKIHELPPAQRRENFRRIAQAQLQAWNGAAGWFLWSYKLLADGPVADGWDLGKAIALGYLPIHPDPLPPGQDAGFGG